MGGDAALSRKLSGLAVAGLPFWQAPFVGIDKLERCLNVRSIHHGCLLFAALQYLGDFIVPAALPHEFVPNVNVVFIWSASVIETPLQDFLVRSAATHSLD
jgi:hypothetical protein